MSFRSLQHKFLRFILTAYIVVGLGTLGAFLWTLNSVVSSLGKDFAVQYVLKEKAVISAPIGRELALARKMADTPALKAWADNESDPNLKREAFDELASFKSFFKSGNWFYIIQSSGHYYFDDAGRTPAEVERP